MIVFLFFPCFLLEVGYSLVARGGVPSQQTRKKVARRLPSGSAPRQGPLPSVDSQRDVHSLSLRVIL